MSLSSPIHQLVLSSSSADVGTILTTPVTSNTVSYINYGGQDCLHLTLATAGISFPCVFTNASSFTISFWLYTSANVWTTPIALGGVGTKNIISASFINTGQFFILGGSLGDYLKFQPPESTILLRWNNFTLTYTSGTYNFYRNGVFISSKVYIHTFTSTEFTIGNTDRYTSWITQPFGGHIYVRQVSIFDSVLSATQITELYTNTGDNTILTNLSIPSGLSTSSLTYNSFTVTWLNGAGATSYRYTLNGTSVTPSTDNGISNKTAIFTGLTPLTTYTLIVTAVSASIEKASPSKTVSTLSPPLPTPVIVSINTLTYNSFVVVWTGGAYATSYTYTLDGTLITPTSQTTQSATFTSLSPLTTYTLVVIAGNNTGPTSSSPMTIITLLAPLRPINQLALNGYTDDWGTSSTDVTVIDPNSNISYASSGGKDCIHINSDGTNPMINIPCIFTQSSQFTVGVWIKFDINAMWCVPITINGSNINIDLGFMGGLYVTTGNGVSSFYTQTFTNVTLDLTQWNHISVSYTNGIIKLYINGVYNKEITFTQEFTTSQITIGGNAKYQYYFNGGKNWDGYLHQLCAFDYTLTAEQVTELYTQTQDNITLANPLTPYRLNISSITKDSFAVSWLGGTGATSYTYTLNGTLITPSTQTTQSAVFTGLTHATIYTLIVTAVSTSEEKSSRFKTVSTLYAPLLPINQFIFDGDNYDVGTSSTVVTVIDPYTNISYINYGGKDCIHINSDGTNPKINIPCIFTETSQFTFGVWIKFDVVGTWCSPISINGTNVDITLGFGDTSMMYVVGNGVSTIYNMNSTYTNLDFIQWSHITVTYTNGILKVYINGVYQSSTSFTQQFTTSQITIGGNAKYQNYSMGGQVIWNGYLHQACVFDSTLDAQEVTELYTKTQDNTQLIIPSDPLTPYGLNISSITTSSLTASWLGGTGATSYSYTLNGTLVTPSTQTSNSAIFTGLTNITTYTLIVTAVSSSEEKSSRSKTVTTLLAPPTPVIVSINTLTYESFVVVWTGGAYATSYTYTLDDTLITPTSQTTQSATFTSLTPLTTYILVVSAVNNAGTTSSSPMTIISLVTPPLPLPINQFVLSYSTDDLGISSTDVTVIDPNSNISYTSSGGKDCIHINSDGTNPKINIPCIFTQASLFTFGFWFKFDAANEWDIPITMNGSNIDITIGISTNSLIVSMGDGVSIYTQLSNGDTIVNFLEWNHTVVTYRNGFLKLYINGVYVGISEIITQEFTTSQITIGGNGQYMYGMSTDVYPWSGFLNQLCVFDSTLAAQQVTELYTKTQDNSTLANSLIPYGLHISSITTNSFEAIWLGGTGATSYRYTLNGTLVTPSTQTTKSAIFTSLTPLTTYTLIVTAVSATTGEEKSSSSKTVTTLVAPPTPVIVSIDTLSSESFTVVWTGGAYATSYTYTLDDSPITPSIDNGLSNKSSTFTGLNYLTSYILVVNAVNYAGTTSSSPMTIITSAPSPLPIPINQLVLSDSNDDTGANITTPITTGDVLYTNFFGNDCLNVYGTGQGIPYISVPCVFTETSSFTISFWLFIDINTMTSGYYCPIALGDGLHSIIIYSVEQTPVVNIYIGNNSSEQGFTSFGGGTNSTPPINPVVGWNNFTITYTTGNYKLYTNGIYSCEKQFIQSFTSTEIIIGRNGKYCEGAMTLTNGPMYIRQVCVFNSALSVYQVIQLYTKTQDYTVLAAPSNPLTPYGLHVSYITKNSFIVTWLGGTGATSYSYTLNGTNMTPESQTNNAAAFIGIIPSTNYTLIITAISASDSQTSRSKTVKTLPNPPTPFIVSIGTITYESFIASWTGGVGATVYSYTLNGIPFTPTSQTTQSATFTELSTLTSYTLIITAVNLGGETSSYPITMTTVASPPLPTPNHQVVFNSTSIDIGSSPSAIAVIDPNTNISYTTRDGKGCIYIHSDGILPTVNIPFIITEASQFTFGFWIKIDDVMPWCVPITMNGSNIDISLGFDSTTMILSVGNGVETSYNINNSTDNNTDFTNWNHITVTYRNEILKVYINGVYNISINVTHEFTTSKITIGGNLQYQYAFGGKESWDGYLHQLCIFNSFLNAYQVHELYTHTQDNTALGIRVPTLEDVILLKNNWNNTITIQGATGAINTALSANLSNIVIVAAALLNETSHIFTALVNNPTFIGTTVIIPSSIAVVLYDKFTDKSTLDTRLPLKVNFPALDGSVSPPTAGSNSKLAIDLTVDAYVTFRGCAGYGIHVIAGEQYFTTPLNPIGAHINIGDILTFTVDGGGALVFKVADLDIVLIPYRAPPSVICFPGSALILTPNGYSRIDSLTVGDIVCTPGEGEGEVIIEKIHKEVYMPGCDTNPYIIPQNKFGSHGRILISPRHKVAVAGEMIEARDLGLEQEVQYEKITYYNLQLTNASNMIVAGLEVESLQSLTRVNIPLETFNYIIANKYDGNLTDEIKKKCHLMDDGTMSVPILI
jgi:hypothetical protein